jgi:hypothetical protein
MMQAMSQVFIKLPSGKTLLLEVKLHETLVQELKAEIKDREGIPVELQRLYHGSRALVDHEILSAAGVIADSQLMVRPVVRSSKLEVRVSLKFEDFEMLVDVTERRPRAVVDVTAPSHLVPPILAKAMLAHNHSNFVTKAYLQDDKAMLVVRNFRFVMSDSFLM